MSYEKVNKLKREKALHIGGVSESLFTQEQFAEQLILHGVSKSFTLEDVKRAVDHWGMTDVPKEEIAKLLNVC